MKLEKALKQKTFKTAEERVFVNILYTAYRLKDLHQFILDPYDISVQQYNILRILRGQFPERASVHLLCERMLDKNSGVSRMVEKLRIKGFVDRTTSRKDRRQVDIRITNTGLELLVLLDEKIKSLHSITNVLSETELGVLNSLLDRLRSKIQI